MIRYAPWLFLMFSLFSCFRKKSPPKTIEPWLEQQFPGQFSVQVSNLKILDVMAQFRGDKRAVVADKSDPDVQFLLNWQKGVAGLGLDTSTVQQAHARAKMQVAEGRALFELLKTNGLENFSVGVVDKTLTIQVFGEPAPALREQTLGIIQTTLKEQPGQSLSRVFVGLLEPAAYHTEYQNIIPRGHWETGTGWQRENGIMTLRLDHSAGQWTMQAWEISPESKRGQVYKDDAFQQARAWADKNLPQPYFMDADQPYSIERPPQAKIPKNVPAIRYAFPYFDSAPSADAEPAGYVTGIYYPDRQVLANVQKQREF